MRTNLAILQVLVLFRFFNLQSEENTYEYEEDLVCHYSKKSSPQQESGEYAPLANLEGEPFYKSIN